MERGELKICWQGLLGELFDCYELEYAGVSRDDAGLFEFFMEKRLAERVLQDWNIRIPVV